MGSRLKPALPVKHRADSRAAGSSEGGDGGWVEGGAGEEGSTTLPRELSKARTRHERRTAGCRVHICTKTRRLHGRCVNRWWLPGRQRRGRRKGRWRARVQKPDLRVAAVDGSCTDRGSSPDELGKVAKLLHGGSVHVVKFDHESEKEVGERGLRHHASCSSSVIAALGGGSSRGWSGERRHSQHGVFANSAFSLHVHQPSRCEHTFPCALRSRTRSSHAVETCGPASLCDMHHTKLYNFRDQFVTGHL